nr:hypothetical protein [Tanacetum cinerariifolium]
RHDQQWARVLLFAHGLVLDQLQQLVAKHHGAGRYRQRAADLEGVLRGLAGQAIVVQEVVEHVAQAFHHTGAA